MGFCLVGVMGVTVIWHIYTGTGYYYIRYTMGANFNHGEASWVLVDILVLDICFPIVSISINPLWFYKFEVEIRFVPPDLPRN